MDGVDLIQIAARPRPGRARGIDIPLDADTILERRLAEILGGANRQ